MFICQAFGIPATGVGQPAHACVAYRKPDGIWATAYGRSFAASHLLGMSGNEFVEGMLALQRPAQYARAEHLRWIALALAGEQQAAVAAIASRVASAPAVIERIPFDEKPDATSPLTSFEAPRDVADGYGARMRGFLYPPANGDYTFMIASDDESDLFLSTDASPDSRQLVAFTREWTEPGQFDKFPSQKSQPVRLEAGKKYYIEAVHKENSGGDHVEVAWSGPGLAEGIIDGKYLSPYPSGAKGSIGREMWRDEVRCRRPAEAAGRQAGAGRSACRPASSTSKPRRSSTTAAARCMADIPACGFRTATRAASRSISRPTWAASGRATRSACPRPGSTSWSAKASTVNFDQYMLVRSYGASLPVKQATASQVYKNMVKDLGPQQAVDGNPGTRWAVIEGRRGRLAGAGPRPAVEDQHRAD